MSNKGKSPLVPKLRFHEFRTGNPWDEVPMNQVYCFKGNNALSREKFNYERGTIKNIHYGDIHTKFSTHFDITREEVPYINESDSPESPKPDNFCIEGDMIFADASEDIEDVGKAIEIIHLNGEQVVSGLHTILARQTKPNLVTGFGGHLFRSNRIRVQIQKESQGAKVLGLAVSRLAKIKIPFPRSTDEQEKIAICLNTLDELIAAQARKVDALKTHKSGLMLKLFPREGETEPRIRIAEYRGTGAWQKRKLSSLLTKSVNPVVVDSAATYREIGIRSHGKGIFHKAPVSGQSLGEKRVFWVAVDALILNIVFAWEQALAVASAAEVGMIASHRFPMFKAKPGKADVRFMKYFFLTKKGKELLGIASPGGAGRNKTLGKKDFDSLEFLSPSNAEEQRGIADLLTSIDEIIASQIQRLDTLKTHQKGLMQQLFPSAETNAI